MREESTPKRSKLPLFLSVATILLLAATGEFLWILDNRIYDLRKHLSVTEQRAASIEQGIIQRSNQVISLQGKLITTQQQALRAEHRSDELETASRESQLQVQQLRQQSAVDSAAAAQAAQKTQEAVAARQKAVGELEGMRQRRVAELDRMQQALSRIVPTMRTATGMVMQLANKSFRFDFDSAALKIENRETLSRIAGVLLVSEGYRLFIDGHTDDIGTDVYNQRLSERRADSVRDYLVAAGVPANIIEVKGFGKSNLLVQGKTAGDREKNRRVEIGVVDTIISYQTEDDATKQSKQ